MQAFLAASVWHHDPVRGPAGAAAAATLLAAALSSLALTGCWWRVSRLAHRFSRRALWYGLALVVALGMALACVALAVRWPAACALAAGLALACMLATARSAVASNELLLHGGVAWKTPRGLWRALSNEDDRASVLMRLAIFALETLIILGGVVQGLGLGHFLDAGGGNVLVFFELPNSPAMGLDGNTPEWVQHIAFKVGSLDELAASKARLEAGGIAVLGPTDHTIFKSIYFFDPNGHRLELACDTATVQQQELEHKRL